MVQNKKLKKYSSVDVALGSTVFFMDAKNQIPEQRCGYSQFGIVHEKGKVIYVRKTKYRRKIVVSKLSDIDGDSKIYSHRDSLLSANIARFFNVNLMNPRMFDLAIYKIKNDESFFDDPLLMPKYKHNIDEQYFTEKWRIIGQKLKPADLIFTYDSSSILSKIIKFMDNGLWSHVANYTGDGTVCEAISPRTTERPLSVYKQMNYRIGVYRWHKELSDEARNKIVDNLRSDLGLPYGYITLFKLGWLRLLNRNKFLFEGDFDPDKVTPNDLIYSGNYRLVEFV